MAIACPNCEHRLNLKSPKPGRFRPRCPKCERPFLLVVPTGADESVRVSVIDEQPSRPDVTQRNTWQDCNPSGQQGSRSAPELVLAQSSGNSVSLLNTPTNPDQPTDPGRRPLLGPRSDSWVEPVAEDEEYAPPRTEVRGYRIERELGRGGVGAVYLARQLSLARPVALKVMGKRWAADPTFVARFTREAYAAAQLRHQNIVGIHDVGEVDGSRFFSMEYVPGRSLAELVRVEGKLDPETAVGFVLQAARGLKHAHDRGMIHRDVKPDNLLIDDQGLVKVADLGLVKVRDAADEVITPDSHPLATPARPTTGLTEVRVALGTPAYMSPEQCRDAAAVDHRADIYSLGCTLYVLVTGRPPFDGTTAVELMTKHAYEPIVPPEQIVSRVPPAVSAVIQRMMAKGADERFQDMGEVIRTLEAWLGVRHAGTFSPSEEQISKLEGYALAFNTATAAVLRARSMKGFVFLAGLASVLLLFFGRGSWSSGVVGMMLLAGLAYFLFDGAGRKGPLYVRVRQFVWGLSWWDCGITVAGVGLFGILLAMSGVFWIWVGFGAAGVGLAAALRFGLDRRVDDDRRGPLDGCERLLRRMRAQGLDEEQLRLFVAKFAGRHWEEFFESLFGYEAKLTARSVLSQGGFAGPRERFASWREPLIGFVDRVERTRKAAREQRLLEAVERARLLAEGAAAAEADRKAEATARALVHHAGQVQQSQARWMATGWGRAVGGEPVVGVSLLAGGASHADFRYAPEPPDPLGRVVKLFVGAHVRAAVAAALLAACGTWVFQNGMISPADVQTRAQVAIEAGDSAALEGVTANASWTARPLRVEGVPPAVTRWADSFNVGVAGLLLVGSLFRRGNMMSVLVLLGAGVVVAGHHLGLRAVGPVNPILIGLLLGSVLTLVGFRTSTR